MTRITRFTTTVASIAVLAFVSVAIAAPKGESKNKAFILSGRILEVDKSARTLLIREQSGDRLYLVKVPKNATFQITFGRHMKLTYPGIEDVVKNESVRMKVRRTDEDRLSLLDDGREVVALTAVN